MVREMVKIDEALCNGCGECIPNCHEGALQIIDNKARLVSDLMCDGLGACVGHCPMGAISIEKREAEPYNETKVMRLMIEKGKNTVIAHLKHLKDHNELDYLKEGEDCIKAQAHLPFNLQEVFDVVHGVSANQSFKPIQMDQKHTHGGGCPGSQERIIVPINNTVVLSNTGNAPSELRQWPVQLHLVNPSAVYFKNADVVIAADCVAFAMGNFHDRFLKGKALAIACPKLDSGQDVYVKKITALVNAASINTLTVVIMQVPCCRGLLQLAKDAINAADRKIPLKLAVVSAEGEVLSEDWV